MSSHPLFEFKVLEGFDENKRLLVIVHRSGRKYVALSSDLLRKPSFFVVAVQRPNVWVFKADGYNMPTPVPEVALTSRLAAETRNEVERDVGAWFQKKVQKQVKKTGSLLFTFDLDDPQTLEEYRDTTKIDYKNDNVQREVAALNARLNHTCPGWRLELGDLFNLPSYPAAFSGALNSALTLCLYFRDRCKSSVAFVDEGDGQTLEIQSYTVPDAEGRKFNRFLRACAVLVSQHFLVQDSSDSAWKPVQRLHSDACNPTSVWLLLDYSVTVDDRFTKFLQGKGAVTHQLIQQYLNQYDNVDVYVVLNDKSLAVAGQWIDKLTTGEGRLRCDVASRGSDTKRKREESSEEYESEEELEAVRPSQRPRVAVTGYSSPFFGMLWTALGYGSRA